MCAFFYFSRFHPFALICIPGSFNRGFFFRDLRNKQIIYFLIPIQRKRHLLWFYSSGPLFYYYCYCVIRRSRFWAHLQRFFRVKKNNFPWLGPVRRRLKPKTSSKQGSLWRIQIWIVRRVSVTGNFAPDKKALFVSTRDLNRIEGKKEEEISHLTKHVGPSSIIRKITKKRYGAVEDTTARQGARNQCKDILDFREWNKTLFSNLA